MRWELRAWLAALLNTCSDGLQWIGKENTIFNKHPVQLYIDMDYVVTKKFCSCKAKCAFQLVINQLASEYELYTSFCNEFPKNLWLIIIFGIHNWLRPRNLRYTQKKTLQEMWRISFHHFLRSAIAINAVSNFTVYPGKRYVLFAQKYT